ncbi:MAG: DoxX family protein [Acidobacteriia bacterium]|nr:DoxX family protein [Terriglobia bacterium]
MTTTSTPKPGISGIDAGLLFLRLAAGLSLLLLFGLTKLRDVSAYLHTGQWQFVDFNRKVGLPVPVLVAYLQTLNESIGALFVAAGFLSRYASAALALGFGVATFCSLKMSESAWLIAAFYCVMFTTLLLTGPGKLSIDYLLHSRATARMEEQVPSK